jgi:energy-converting hydrogenase Eha subunit B
MTSRVALPVRTGALYARKDAKSAGTLLVSQDVNLDGGPGTGLLAAPAWVVGVLGAAVVLAGVLYFLLRARAARRATTGSNSVRPAATKIR